MLGRHLVAECLELFRRGADERDVRLVAGADEICVFGEEAVPRMNGVNAVTRCHLDDGRNIQIRADRLTAGRRANQERLVCFEPMQRKPVFVAVDRDGLKPQLGGGAKNADRDFGSIGDEELLHEINSRR